MKRALGATRSRRGLLALGVGFTLWPGTASAKVRTQTLFVLARSTNANVVHYDVRIDGASLDLDEPLLAYWVMRAEDGRREGLTFLERELAYGFRVVSGVTAGGFRVVLKAFDRRALTVRRIAGGGYRAYLRIDGKSAALERIFVSIEGGGVTANVRYVDLFGTLEDGRRVSERFVPCVTRTVRCP